MAHKRLPESNRGKQSIAVGVTELLDDFSEVLIICSAEQTACLKGQKVLLGAVSCAGCDAAQQDAFYGAEGVEVPEHLDRELEVLHVWYKEKPETW